MKLCNVKGKGPTEKAVLIFRLEDTKLKENEEILSLIFHLAVLRKQTEKSYCRDDLSMQLLLARRSLAVVEGAEPRHSQSR